MLGRAAMQEVVERADRNYTQPDGKYHMAWSTDDLADFVQGLVECGVEYLYRLRPEAVKHISEDEAARLDQIYLRLDD